MGRYFDIGLFKVNAEGVQTTVLDKTGKVFEIQHSNDRQVTTYGEFCQVIT